MKTKSINNKTEREHTLLMDRLKSEMQERGITNAKMGNLLAVHESTVSRWINGHIGMTLKDYIKACNILKIKIK